MNNTTISENKVASVNEVDGAGVCLYGAELTMNGGLISKNECYSDYSSFGGGVYIYNSSKFTMTSGVISENSVKFLYCFIGNESVFNLIFSLPFILAVFVISKEFKNGIIRIKSRKIFRKAFGIDVNSVDNRDADMNLSALSKSIFKILLNLLKRFADPLSVKLIIKVLHIDYQIINKLAEFGKPQ